jgi:hypothetical protein
MLLEVWRESNRKYDAASEISKRKGNIATKVQSD